MTISRKLLLATAMLATCVSSIRLHAAYDQTQGAAACFTIFTLGPTLVVRSITKSKVAEELLNMTSTADSLTAENLKKCAQKLQKGQVRNMIIGGMLSCAPTLLLANAIKSDLQNKKA